MAKFVPRTTAPETTDGRYYADNPFYQSGYGMPNCTCYAYGRFWELLGHKPDLSLSDAKNWFNYDDGYLRGTTPKLGAVIVWSNSGAGHVAVVESINSDGSFRTSNSAWKSTLFYMQDIPADCSLSGFEFLGFIYCPVDFNTDGGYKIPEPVSGNRYLTQSEMEGNAAYIYYKLSAAGWSMNAIAGMLGNMEVESTINPGIWESLVQGNMSGGFGLVQWTPAYDFIRWCGEFGYDPEAMDTALYRLEYEMENGLQYYPTSNYPETFQEFKVSTQSPYYLGMAFVHNYERPAEITTARGTNAEKWYNFLLSLPKPGKRKTRSLPLWLMWTASRRRV